MEKIHDVGKWEVETIPYMGSEDSIDSFKWTFPGDDKLFQNVSIYPYFDNYKIDFDLGYGGYHYEVDDFVEALRKVYGLLRLYPNGIDNDERWKALQSIGVVKKKKDLKKML